MAVVAVVAPLTVTGTLENPVVVPSPSWPESPTPQHCTRPSLRSAQACSEPSPTVLAFVMLRTPTGTPELPSVLSPSPSCPRLLRPQHCTVPSERLMQPKYAPPATVVALMPPLVVNCCVWPTTTVGLPGATVMAKAGAPSVRPRTNRPAASRCDAPWTTFTAVSSELDVSGGRSPWL